MASEQSGKPEPAKLGLREKKKRKTRMTLQQQAMRLFREQGYHATTIEQIAEASEISPSTFFRYFATKEALVLEDEYDPILVKVFREQLTGLSPVSAMRATIREIFSSLTGEERTALHDRMTLSISVPELRAASLIQMNESLQLIADLVAERLNRSRDDFEVFTFAGSVFGVVMAGQLYCLNHPEADFFTTMDRMLGHLEEGLQLT
ncbi:transcriptional regulator, TetR family [Paenibacillus curdlanolyticus YK9]|uniref:Transcriptional regulator, TetR family n=1 Tax=Paenibacillus curdlanolyticus YK9 TaxID=717606 RepID=E0IDK6_9BACL|nr:TetR family transcriptional regulator [Paenibacillus curdlanolyticus]EFM09661.1 transcriptional regulator, TetR family [Paenibacillus curdlanolyticus YK9]